MKRFFINNKNNKSYTLDELSKQEINSKTKVKVVGGTEWVTADTVDELNDQLNLNASYEKLRKVIKPRHRKLSIAKILVVSYILVFIRFLPVTSDTGMINVLPFSDFKIIGMSIVLGWVVIRFIFKLLLHRYAWIVKKTEKSNQKTDKVRYEIQTFLSFKANKKEFNEKKVKWKKSKHRSYSDLSDAKKEFDKLTIEKRIYVSPITEVLKRNRKPRLIEELQQKNKLFYMNPLNFLLRAGLIITLILIVGIGAVYYALKIKYSNAIQQEEIYNIINMIGGSIVGLYLILILHVKTSKCYLRVIKRRVKQGMYVENTYHLQYYVTRKKIEQVQNNKKIKWENLNMIKSNFGDNFRKPHIIGHKGTLLEVFNKSTGVTRVTEERLS